MFVGRSGELKGAFTTTLPTASAISGFRYQAVAQTERSKTCSVCHVPFGPIRCVADPWVDRLEIKARLMLGDTATSPFWFRNEMM